MNSFLQAVTEFLRTHWSDMLWPAALFGGVVLMGLLLRRIVFRRLHAWAGRTGSHLDSVLLESLRGPVLLWIIILGINVATDLSRLPPAVTRWSGRALMILWIVSLTLVLSRLAGKLVQKYLARGPGAAPVGTLPQTLAGLLVALLGTLMLLNEFGISITPILTALGVGGLAVALALQDTLSNLFAGFYVSLSQQMRLGDFIQLESGQRGYVSDIGWRSTTLREREGNLIVIPNNKLAQSIVTNYHLPQPRIMLKISIGVSYASDPEHVERVLSELVRDAAGNVPGLLSEPAPAALLVGFGDHSLNFIVVCHVTDYEAQFPVQNTLRKRILRRFNEENIVIPYPTRTVEYREPQQTRS